MTSMFILFKAVVIAFSVFILRTVNGRIIETECTGIDQNIQEQGVLKIICTQKFTIYDPTYFLIGRPDGYQTWKSGAFSGPSNQMMMVSTGNKTQNEALYALQILGGKFVLIDVIRETKVDSFADFTDHALTNVMDERITSKLAQFADHVLKVYEKTGDYFPDFDGDWRTMYDWNKKVESDNLIAESAYFSGVKDLFGSMVETNKDILFITH